MSRHRKRILFLGPEEGFLSALECAPDSVEVIRCDSELESVANNLRHVQALVDASMKIPITATVLSDAEELQVVSTATTGSDHIDRQALSVRGITLYTLRDDKEVLKNITAAAEHSWMLLMALASQLLSACADVNAGEWRREKFPSVMLKDKILGLVGCGRIGQWMARYGAAFGMQVIAYDPYVDPWPDLVESVELEALFELSDFISVHVHLSDDTVGLITKDLFRRVKSGAIFINTSRGGLVDEGSLVNALQSGRLGGAGLDVLQGEPNINGNSLVKYSRENANLLITPHCGGYSPDAVQIVCQRAMEKVIRFFQETVK